MSNHVITIKHIIYAFLVLLFVLASIAVGVSPGFITVMTLWLVCMLYCLNDAPNHIITICFLFTFFMFLLGAYFCAQYFNYTEHVVLFDDNITGHIYRSLFLALLGILASELIVINVPRKKGDLQTQKAEFNDILKGVSKYMYFITLIPYFVSELLRISVAQAQGYTGIYLIDANSMLPYWFRLIAYLCPVCLYLFLATLPSKAEARVPLILFVFYSTLTLLSGQRSVFVINVMLVFVYCYLRNSEKAEVWITKKFIIIAVLSVPILMVGLNMVGYARFGGAAESRGIIHSLLDTLTSQGVSISVIGYEKYYEASIPNKLYTFGGIIEFFKSNPISQSLFHFATYTGQSPERALNGNLFSHLISYYVLPWGYEHGQGLGSSYIAESYHDFGYLGVFIISCIYGKLLRVCSRFNQTSLATRFFMLNMLYALFMAPRGLTDAFLSNLLNVQVWVALFISLSIASIIYNRKNSLMTVKGDC